MNKRFLRTSLSLFDLVSDKSQYKDSIIFIEDTNQIWTNGVYYDCSPNQDTNIIYDPSEGMNLNGDTIKSGDKIVVDSNGLVYSNNDLVINNITVNGELVEKDSTGGVNINTEEDVELEIDIFYILDHIFRNNGIINDPYTYSIRFAFKTGNISLYNNNIASALKCSDINEANNKLYTALRNNCYKIKAIEYHGYNHKKILNFIQDSSAGQIYLSDVYNFPVYNDDEDIDFFKIKYDITINYQDGNSFNITSIHVTTQILNDPKEYNINLNLTEIIESNLYGIYLSDNNFYQEFDIETTLSILGLEYSESGLNIFANLLYNIYGKSIKACNYFIRFSNYYFNDVAYCQALEDSILIKLNIDFFNLYFNSLLENYGRTRTFDKDIYFGIKSNGSCFLFAEHDTRISSLKTINGQSILGSGDITIEGGTSFENVTITSGDIIDEGDYTITPITFSDGEINLPSINIYAKKGEKGETGLTGLNGVFAIEYNNGLLETTSDLEVGYYNTRVIELTETSSNISINPNDYYRYINPVTSLTFTLNTPVNPEIVNNYLVEFTTSNNGCTLILPDIIKWANGEVPDIQQNCTYQLSIINNLAVIQMYNYA